MKIRNILTLLPVALIFASCSPTTDPTPTPVVNDPDPQIIQRKVPVHGKNYDAARGGVQITAIYYDQNANRDSFALASPEEWIILESDKSVNTTGWQLDGGSNDGQHYPLPNTINQKLYIFTRQGDVPTSVTSGRSRISLGLNVWIWNNADPDTATILNANGEVVDKLTY